jgi:hypothetical protein
MTYIETLLKRAHLSETAAAIVSRLIIFSVFTFAYVALSDVSPVIHGGFNLRLSNVVRALSLFDPVAIAGATIGNIYSNIARGRAGLSYSLTPILQGAIWLAAWTQTKKHGVLVPALLASLAASALTSFNHLLFAPFGLVHGKSDPVTLAVFLWRAMTYFVPALLLTLKGRESDG